MARFAVACPWLPAVQIASSGGNVLYFRAVVFLCLLSEMSQPAFSQNPQPVLAMKSANSAAAKAGLAQTVSRLGWDRGRAQRGVIAQGNKITLDAQGQELSSTSILLEMRSDHRFRMEFGSGEVLTVADAVASMRRAGASQASQLLPHIAVSMAAPYFPFLTDVATTNDLDVGVADPLMTKFNDEPIASYAIHRDFSAATNFQPARASSSRLRLWVSQTTGLPVRLDFFRLALDNWQMALPFSLYFSQWQLVEGVMIPMQIDEGSGEQVFTRMRFSSVQFNPAIPDSEFMLTGGTN